jgi:transposase InsO family protein
MVLTLTRRDKRLLRRAYFDPSHPAAFSSPDKLYRALNRRISRGKVKKILQSQQAHTVLNQVKRKFKRLKVVSPFISYLWDLDTASMTFYVKGKDEKQFFSNKNRGYKYFLVAIDVFSKFLWTYPLKTLKANEMRTVLRHLLNIKKPDFIRTDRGSEFKNAAVRDLLRRENVGHILTLNETKANYAERVIRTIKDKMGKYLEEQESHEWIDVLPKITESYNKTYHRSIKKAPSEVRKADEIAIWKMTYENIKKVKPRPRRPPRVKSSPYKFSVGDYVRIVAFKGAFDKSAFSHKWTTELHVIVDRDNTQGIPRYKLVDYSREEIVGYFYERELQKVYLEGRPYFKIEKVIRQRRRRGVGVYFVKFKNWPDKYNTWVREVRNLN